MDKNYPKNSQNESVKCRKPKWLTFCRKCKARGCAGGCASPASIEKKMTGLHFTNTIDSDDHEDDADEDGEDGDYDEYHTAMLENRLDRLERMIMVLKNKFDCPANQIRAPSSDAGLTHKNTQESSESDQQRIDCPARAKVSEWLRGVKGSGRGGPNTPHS